MTNLEISVITGLSLGTISNILNGKADKYNTETVNQVKALKSLEVDYFEQLFKEPDFASLCSTVAEKSRVRDHEEIVEIKRFANKCLRKYRTLNNKNAKVPYEDDITQLLEVYLADTKVLMQDRLFGLMCNVGMLRCEGLTGIIDLLMDIHEMLTALANKRKKKGASDVVS